MLKYEGVQKTKIADVMYASEYPLDSDRSLLAVETSATISMDIRNRLSPKLLL